MRDPSPAATEGAQKPILPQLLEQNAARTTSQVQLWSLEAGKLKSSPHSRLHSFERMHRAPQATQVTDIRVAVTETHSTLRRSKTLLCFVSLLLHCLVLEVGLHREEVPKKLRKLYRGTSGTDIVVQARSIAKSPHTGRCGSDGGGALGTAGPRGTWAPILVKGHRPRCPSSVHIHGLCCRASSQPREWETSRGADGFF